MSDVISTTRDRADANVRRLIDGTEQLMKELRRDGGDQYRQTMERIGRDIDLAKEQLDDLQDTVAARTRALARRADRSVHSHPWETAGAAAGAALLLGVTVGLLIGRSTPRNGDEL
jgi:ElaB/YqjD/DUF883 family membrane-anchored ribosome-binding protein